MELLIYLLKVCACTALFFSFYLLILNKLTFFKFNRFYLLGSLIISFIIPALHFTVEREVEFEKKELITSTSKVPTNTVIKKVQSVQPDELSEIEEPSIDWSVLAFYCYLLIASVMFFISALPILKLIKYTRKYHYTSSGLKLVRKTTGFTNCSFFNYVFIDETRLSNTDLHVLLQHELVHSKQLHSLDKIFLMLIKAILWFNPFIYFFDKTLEQLHEYEADESTSEHVGNHAYANLLLRLAVKNNEMPLVHNFVKSPIKARIKMLFNSKTNGKNKLIYVSILPICLGMLWLFSIQVVYAETKAIEGFKFKYEKPLMAKKPSITTIKVPSNITITNKIKDKADTVKLVKTVAPNIISYSNLKENVLTKIVYLEDAIIEIEGNRLKAKYVQWDKRNNQLTAYKAENINGSNVIISDKIIFNLNNGAFKTFNSSDEGTGNSIDDSNQNQKDSNKEVFRYSVQDSVKQSKDKTLLTLYGMAKIYFKNIVIEADEITFDQKTNSGKAKNVLLTNESGTQLKGSNAEFNLNGTVKILQNSGKN